MLDIINVQLNSSLGKVLSGEFKRVFMDFNKEYSKKLEGTDTSKAIDYLICARTSEYMDAIKSTNTVELTAALDASKETLTNA